MIEVKGKYNEARIFTDTVDSGSVVRVDKIIRPVYNFKAGSEG